MKIGYILAKQLDKIFKNSLLKYFRKCGIKIGQNCLIYSNIYCKEGYLISIGNNVTISNDVQLLTHDFSIHHVLGKSTLYGRINIGNNVFIGNRTIILPGVSLPNNVIVAAGSVVTKSFFKENIIIGGNPAKVIGDWEQYKSKYSEKGICWTNRNKLKEIIYKNEEKLIKK